ncbi:hypothetical protein [Flagellimonas pacifica]|uniref:Uncharacterized protein n=1 Tax=Flagellimonas pacifica TaxID=1247520 RepID=A0A285MZK9_9FLAO|nr:hypothetical protein [Allomuricauda parva]SNZ01236.1 hypothetical protein SAMN06265377_3073 [Allomuricauda parva]
MFGIFKKRTYQIDFSEDNKEQFTTLLTEIHEILRDSAYSAQANWMMQILSTVDKEDQEGFKSKVISAELLGGAGSVVDVYLDDEESRNRLGYLMNTFLRLVIKSGLNHRAVKSRIY